MVHSSPVTIMFLLLLVILHVSLPSHAQLGNSASSSQPFSAPRMLVSFSITQNQCVNGMRIQLAFELARRDGVSISTIDHSDRVAQILFSHNYDQSFDQVLGDFCKRTMAKFGSEIELGNELSA